MDLGQAKDLTRTNLANLRFLSLAKNLSHVRDLAPVKNPKNQAKSLSQIGLKRKLSIDHHLQEESSRILTRRTSIK